MEENANIYRSQVKGLKLKFIWHIFCLPQFRSYPLINMIFFYLFFIKTFCFHYLILKLVISSLGFCASLFNASRSWLVWGVIRELPENITVPCLSTPLKSSYPWCKDWGDPWEELYKYYNLLLTLTLLTVPGWRVCHFWISNTILGAILQEDPSVPPDLYHALTALHWTSSQWRNCLHSFGKGPLCASFTGRLRINTLKHSQRIDQCLTCWYWAPALLHKFHPEIPETG